MEYVQERITTLHAFDTPAPPAPVEDATVVVPLAARDAKTDAAGSTFRTLEAVDPGRVLIALRAGPGEVDAVVPWLRQFDLRTEILWCTAPPVEAYLDRVGTGTVAGKGRDVWLALGLARNDDYVVIHDVDARSYDETHVPRLLFPLDNGCEFSKGYYARVEQNRLYGRLFRLLYTPLVRALESIVDSPLVRYLDSFRYALAGEFAVTGELAGRLRPPAGWGLEIATLRDAYDETGLGGTAQVDLGTHKHHHRPVSGSGGLGEMAEAVAATMFAILEKAGCSISYPTLVDEYMTAGYNLVEQYATDAAFNDLSYDVAAEREQVTLYAETISPPEDVAFLPAWTDTAVDAETIRDRSATAIAERLQVANPHQ